MAIFESQNGSFRNNFVEPPSLLARIHPRLPAITRWIEFKVQTRAAHISAAYARARRRNKRAGHGRVILGLLFTLPNLLIFLWALTLWWGERTVFRESVSACDWAKWENWPSNTLPHHVVFIADPQLVDAHTYPGRPWPLSALTVFYSDLYLYRTHSLLQQNLRPDSTFFLGDLFDGGREWGTATSSSPDPRYKKYRNNVWMKEYRRFVKLFFDTWKLGGKDSLSAPRGRKLVAGIPGNHDLGFGNGIQRPVVDRFRAFFGEGNRVDVIGNHTFVSIDSVSLSAMDQPDPKTGGSDTGGIWKETKDFLNDIQKHKSRAIQEEILALNGEPEGSRAPHVVQEARRDLKSGAPPARPLADLPTILLTHVPLYRPPYTPCGPLREHYPPSSADPVGEKDESNSIRISGGYQYQNVLTQTVSNEIISKIGSVMQIYSGDDHDYCEVVHREFSGAPREITVKSTSLAMSVRRPAVQLASLWNPIDPVTGEALKQTGSGETLQNHMCLFPDQISVFIRYGYALILTILILFGRALFHGFISTNGSRSEIGLPFANGSSGDSQRRNHSSGISSVSTSSSTSLSLLPEKRFGNRPGDAGDPTTCKASSSSSSSEEGSRRGLKHIQIIGASGAVDDAFSNDSNRLRKHDWGVPAAQMKDRAWDEIDDEYCYSDRDDDMQRARSSNRSFRQSMHIFRSEFVSSIKWVGGVSFFWYLWLLWTW
ncbi:hypothetical protein FQN57_000989 [Myotisia sp. PD_48]|nr:hypothetical protein FQN57_000989 [Myotisia sp. PD_48]